LFRAKYFVAEHGINGSGSSSTDCATEQPILFVHEFPLLAGYLIGVCHLPVKAQITTVKVIAFAGRTAPTIFTLEINGVLSPHELIIPAGRGEVSASATLNLAVDANTLLRWKATSGPAPTEDAPSMIGLTMNVKELA